jgi:drug/metabolite transporter (DMT)-like permease
VRLEVARREDFPPMIGYRQPMKSFFVLLCAAGLVIAGAWMIFDRSFLTGVAAVLVGLVCAVSLPLIGRRENRRAHLVLALIGVALTLVVGLILLIAPPDPMGYARWAPDSPFEMRIWAIVVVAACVIGLVLGVRRLRRTRR